MSTANSMLNRPLRTMLAIIAAAAAFLLPTASAITPLSPWQVCMNSNTWNRWM